MNDHAWLRELLAAGMFHNNSDAIAALLAELDRLRARLEVTPQGPDGIDARDETIRALEGDASRYKWLKSKAIGYQWDEFSDTDPENLDAAIDAARGMGEAEK